MLVAKPVGSVLVTLVVSQYDDAILRLSLEEAGVLTTCDISTIYRDSSDDVSLMIS